MRTILNKKYLEVYVVNEQIKYFITVKIVTNIAYVKQAVVACNSSPINGTVCFISLFAFINSAYFNHKNVEKA